MDRCLPAGLRQACCRDGCQPTHNTKRCALNLGLDQLGGRKLCELHFRFEFEAQVSDMGFENGAEMSSIDGFEIAHAFDARGEERCIAEGLKNRIPRCNNCNITREIQNN